VLLVDDEPNVRAGVRMMIPWAEIGCEVIGEADDGDDGLSKIMTLRPDIVVADIKMPGKTGIEMTQAAKALGFNGKVIILSGYNDFAYAKDAIALGVENFILKPVDEDELAEAISAAGKKIEKERERSINQQIGKEYINEQMIKGVFFGNEEYISRFESEYDRLGFLTAVVSCDDDDKSDAYSAVRRFFDTVSNVDIIQIDISGVLGLLFKSWNKADIYSALERLNESLAGKVYIACGEYVLDARSIRKSYACAEYLYRSRFVYEEKGIVTDADIRRPQDDPIDYPERVYAFMEINDTKKMNALLDNFKESLRFMGNTPEKAKVSCITLVMDIRARIVRTVADKKPENLITDEFMAGLEESRTLSVMVASIKSVLTEVSDTCFAKSTKSNMERVVQYIKSNYDRELRLEMLAGIFGYNSAYLGKVFHQYTGENFNNYLDNIRITEAKRLLKDEDYKVYEVAEMVGYNNINYFHNKFKKSVGMSPLSFKKQYGSGGDDGEEE
ncbi:MAG: response regulator, partial [Oscillospiraceae bacterium]|nr:response regulator [Oscillospiraceae bacterium]